VRVGKRTYGSGWFLLREKRKRKSDTLPLFDHEFFDHPKLKPVSFTGLIDTATFRITGSIGILLIRLSDCTNEQKIHK
jgi:hypothetical protein